MRINTMLGEKLILLLFLTLLLSFIISMNLGKMSLTPSEVLNVIFGNVTPKQNLIVYEFRFPRIVLFILVGIGR